MLHEALRQILTGYLSALELELLRLHLRYAWCFSLQLHSRSQRLELSAHSRTLALASLLNIEGHLLLLLGLLLKLRLQ